MAQPQYPPPASERWNVNLPAVIGVVFVFLVGVIIWVIAASGDGDGDGDGVAATSSSTVTSDPGGVTSTTAEGAGPDAVPGDLGIPGYAMQAPPCNESFITIIASAVGADVAAEGILVYLEDYPTSNYLRTDQTCPSLNPSVDGQPIYVVYFGPFPFAEDACEARAEGTDGAYVRQLSSTQPPNHTVTCSA